MKTNDATRATSEAMHRTESRAVAEAASEFPHDKVRRLSRELSQALDDDGHYALAMIYPASRHQFPISWCMDGDYARQSYAMLRYRDAARALADRGGKGVRRLRAERDTAHHELVNSFFEVAS